MIDQKKKAETARRNRLEASFKLTPDHALRFLLAHGKRIKYGENQYVGVVNLIRELIQQRGDLQKEIARLQAALTKATTPTRKPFRAFDTQGQGDWGGDLT